MSKNTKQVGRIPLRLASILAASALFGIFQIAVVPFAEAANQPSGPSPSPGAKLAPCSTINVAPPTTIALGKSTIAKLTTPVARLVVGGLGSAHAGKPVDADAKAAPAASPAAAASTTRNGVAEVDVMLLSPKELYLLGKRVGSMNLILQDQAGKCTVMDIAVTMDAGSLQSKLAEIMPDEKNIKIAAAEDSLILSGEVRDAAKVERAMTLAAVYASDKRVVNMLRTSAMSQVMLEVKVAEVSKTLLDQLGARVSSNSSNSGWVYSILSEFLTPGKGLVQALKVGKGAIAINGQKDDGVVRILAEPNIMAISGQQASFLSGGKIFIPVSQSANAGLGSTITLEEKEFGVGVKFTPTVLEGGRINLRVASEVSELSQTGSPFTTIGGTVSVLPSMTTRKADTTVQLMDGQSLAIAGLIKNNVSETIKRFPGLGETPLLGALFRSTEFQNDMTELLFIITPRLVKPLPPNYPLPTDNFKVPGRNEFMYGGKMEGSPEETSTPTDQPKAGDAAPAPEKSGAVPAPEKSSAAPSPVNGGTAVATAVPVPAAPVVTMVPMAPMAPPTPTAVAAEAGEATQLAAVAEVVAGERP